MATRHPRYAGTMTGGFLRDPERARRIFRLVWIWLATAWAFWLAWLAVFFFVLHGRWPW